MNKNIPQINKNKEKKLPNDLSEEEEFTENNYQKINSISLQESLKLSNPPIDIIIDNIKNEFDSGLMINKLEKEKMLMNYEDFELSLHRQNPIFVRNLLNIINVINLLWLIVKKNVLNFHQMLKKFNSKFGYLDEEFTDFVLAIPLQKAALMKVFEMENPFPDLSEDYTKVNYLYLDIEKIKSYSLQEMSLSAMFSKANIYNIINYPYAIFYIKQNSVINNFIQLFQYPLNIKTRNIKRASEFRGYNEIDYVVYVKSNDVILDPTNMINYVSIDDDKNYLNKQIKFTKNKIHFFEFKTQGNNISNFIDELSIKSKRFMKIYKSNVIPNFQFFEHVNEYQCHFIYDEKRDSTLNNLSEVKDKETSIIYSSPGNQVSLLISILNNQKKFDKQLSEIKNEFNVFKKNISNLFKDKINPKSSYIKYEKDIINKIIDFKSNLTEVEKFEYQYISLKSSIQRTPELFIELFELYFREHTKVIKELDNKISNFFKIGNNIQDLLVVFNCLGKSNFKEEEVEKLKNLFNSLNIKCYNDVLYLCIKYVFFQIGNETLLDCFSDPKDAQIHDMIINLFKLAKYQKIKKLKSNEMIPIETAILVEVMKIAKLNKEYSRLCCELLLNYEINLKQFIIGSILLNNSENGFN